MPPICQTLLLLHLMNCPHDQVACQSLSGSPRCMSCSAQDQLSNSSRCINATHMSDATALASDELSP